MQDGPRFLTDLDINTAYVYTNLTAGAGGGTTNSTNQTASGLTIDFTNLGQIGQTADGRKYRLVTLAGATTVTPGTLLVSPTRSTNYAALAVATVQPANTAYGNAENTVNSATAKGSTSFNVINGAGAAITADQFAGGFVEIVQTIASGSGPVAFKLQGNTAASTSKNVTLYLADPLNVPYALVQGTDTVSLVPSPFAGVLATTILGNPVGVLTAQAPNTASNTYAAWVQTRGEAMGVVDANGATAYLDISQSTTTSGDFQKWASAASGPAIGIAQVTGTSSTIPIYLTLD